MSMKTCEGSEGSEIVVMDEPTNAGFPDGGDEIRRPKTEIRRKAEIQEPKQA
jgi:hypothetical protein